MSDALRGNFEPANPVKVSDDKQSLVEQFEREALKKLGGSIAFVSRKKFLWTGDDKDNDKKEQ